MPTTVTIADDLAKQLKPYEAELPEILQLGIREWQARRETGYNGVSAVLETLASLPAPEEVLALRPGANRGIARKKPDHRPVARGATRMGSVSVCGAPRSPGESKCRVQTQGN
jgi:hypothetical protein